MHARLTEPQHDVARRSDPADPQPTPEGLGGRADRDEVLVGRRSEDGRRRRPVQREVAERLVADHRCAVPGRQCPQPRAGRGVQRRAGGVVVVGRQVHGPRCGLAQRGLEHVQVEAVLPDRDGYRAGARGADGRQRVRVGGVLDGHPVSRADQHGHQQARGGLGAVGDQDLLGPGGHAARRVPLGQPGSQLGQPEVGVAAGVGPPGEPVDGAVGGFGQPGQRGGCGDREVHRPAVVGVGDEQRGGPLGALRHGRDAARAAPGPQHALLAQSLVGGRRGGPRDAERRGQLSLRSAPGCRAGGCRPARRAAPHRRAPGRSAPPSAPDR